MCLLMGIDLGSTSLKAVLFDENGRCVAMGSVPTRVEYLNPEHPTWAFWHPDHVWESVAAAIRAAIKQVPISAEINGVAVTSFGMDGVPIDKEGNWLYPFISWHCVRTIPQSQKMVKMVNAEEIFNRTGKQVEQIDSIYRMMWIKENEPEILEKTDKWLLIGDFINFKLCGSRNIDYSMAFCTSVFDPLHKQWDDTLIRKAGIAPDIFPEPVQAGERLGEVSPEAAAKTGLRAGTPVFQGGHDYICSALSMGVFNEARLMDITGTWEMVISASECIHLEKNIFEQGLSWESHVACNRYCLVGSAVSSDMVEWFRTNLCYEEMFRAGGNTELEWDFLIQMAQSAPLGGNGCLFLPHFAGAGAPHRNDESRGAFVGMSDKVDRACMFRAVFEGLTYQMREMIEAFESALGKKFEEIVVTGGAVKNSFWIQLKADVTNKEILVANSAETTALGGAILAGLGLGIYKNEQDAINKTFSVKKRYLPDKRRAGQYERWFRIYKKVYSALYEINRDISRM